MNKVLITGATGMIGSNLIDVCVDHGVEVVAVIRPNSKKIDNIKSSMNVEIIECDINDISSLKDKVKDIDVFYHFAWEGVFGQSRNDVSLQENNIKNIFECVKVAHSIGAKKFVFAGSQAEYGALNEKAKCNSICCPNTPYGIAKICASRLAYKQCQQLGMEYCSGRILSAYGARDSDCTMIMTTINKMLNNEDCDFSSGEQIWDYINEVDVARAFYLLGESGVNGEDYPIGSGEERKLKDYILDIKAIVGGSSKLNFGAIPTNPNGLRYLSADISELTRDTGFTPTVAFRNGIAEIVASKNKKQSEKV